MTVIDHPSHTYDDLGRLLSLMTGDEKHAPSATSTLDVLWVLYDRVLQVDPASPDDPERDRFLMSKGHGPMAYYAVLAAKGFFPPEELPGFGEHHSRLGGHPDATLLPGVEISSGSLGHGLPIAVGLALGLRERHPAPPRVFVLLGDGELDEGSNLEAIQVAGRVRLEHLTAIVVDNRSSSLGWPGRIGDRFAGEGWVTSSVDGRHHDALEAALRGPGRGPHAVVARAGTEVTP